MIARYRFNAIKQNAASMKNASSGGWRQLAAGTAPKLSAGNCRILAQDPHRKRELAAQDKNAGNYRTGTEKGERT